MARAKGAGYTLRADGLGLILPVLPGSFVYSLPKDSLSQGCLQQVVQPTPEEMAADPDVLVAREAVLTTAKSARRLSAKPIFDVVHQRAVRARPDASELYTVDHLVDELKGGISFSHFAFDFERANLEIMQTFGALDRRRQAIG